jgi:hypothetical protein
MAQVEAVAWKSWLTEQVSQRSGRTGWISFASPEWRPQLLVLPTPTAVSLWYQVFRAQKLETMELRGSLRVCGGPLDAETWDRQPLPLLRILKVHLRQAFWEWSVDSQSHNSVHHNGPGRDDVMVTSTRITAVKTLTDGVLDIFEGCYQRDILRGGRNGLGPGWGREFLKSKVQGVTSHWLLYTWPVTVQSCQVLVAHAYNPNYLGGWDWKDHG